MGKSAITPVAHRTVLALVVATAVIMGLSSAAAAQDSCAENGCVDVVAVDGLVDEIQASSIVDSIGAADAAGDVEAVVLQMDSEGVAVSDERLAEVASAIADAEVPVTVWIGPSGAVALGGSAELVRVASSSGIAPGAAVGDVGEQRLPVEEFGELFTGDADRDEAIEDASDQFRSKLVFPENRPAIMGVTSDDEGNIWIKVRLSLDENETTYWIADPRRRTVRAVTMDGNVRVMAVRDGSAYAALTTEEGEPLVARYPL